MAIAITVILSLLTGYLFGSVSNGVLIGKIFYGVDVRTQGSHNSGGTNTGRILGKKAGLVTILLDIVKTIASIWIVLFVCRIPAIEELIVIDASYYGYIAGLGACIGHTFPIFFSFKGGKAVACLGGICLATNWILTLLGLAVFMIVLLLSKYVSLSSITAAVSVAVLSYIPFTHRGMVFHQKEGLYYSLLLTLLAAYVVIRHHQNIARLVRGEESKIQWLSKSRKEN